MLQLLHIENIAVIERADIELENGLTVMSGETGAGKSIVIDAIGAILGKRVSRDLIRAGAQKGFVSAVFTELSAGLLAQLEEWGLTGDEPDMLYIQRQITADGKSACRVNMKPATVSTLRTLAGYLIDIHGQNDGQKLLNEQRHLDYLDGFANNAALLAAYRPHFRRLLELKQQITTLETGEQERLQRIDMLAFHKEEIERAALQPGEDEALSRRKAYFDHAGHIADALEQARLLLAGDDELDGACTMLARVADCLHTVSEVSSEVSEAFQSLTDQAEDVRCLAEDLRDNVASQCGNLDFSPAEREQVEQRLDELYRLKQKYGATVADILQYHNAITAELEQLQTADIRRDGLREEYRNELAAAKQAATALTVARREAAEKLQAQIVRELAALDMEKVKLRIAVHTGAKLTPQGFDTAAFAISVNPGEPEKPLSKVASGGELSRIMLALKNVLTASEDVGMLIFDEIDTGVSGHAAQQIAKKLSAIAHKRQTLCVTHLPQIAAMGDHHLLIAKSVRDGRSYTDVHPMDHTHRIDEIARLLSGEEISAAARQNAEDLLHNAAIARNAVLSFSSNTPLSADVTLPADAVLSSNACTGNPQVE